MSVPEGNMTVEMHTVFPRAVDVAQWVRFIQSSSGTIINRLTPNYQGRTSMGSVPVAISFPFPHVRFFCPPSPHTPPNAPIHKIWLLASFSPYKSPQPPSHLEQSITVLSPTSRSILSLVPRLCSLSATPSAGTRPMLPDPFH